MPASVGKPTKAARTAARIQTAALEATEELGYENLTVDEICLRSGISQRTFFNHFPTKEDAVLGSARPVVDEDETRRFLVSRGPLFQEAVRLVRIHDADGQADFEQDFDRRARVVATSPTLLAAQSARIDALEASLEDVIILRLMAQHPDADPATLRREATLVTHLLPGVFRLAMELAKDHAGTDAVQAATETLNLVLEVSAG
jgi:AcrR family transcriptional regulator